MALPPLIFRGLRGFRGDLALKVFPEPLPPLLSSLLPVDTVRDFRVNRAERRFDRWGLM